MIHTAPRAAGSTGISRLSGGFVLVFCSGFGQTFFIALFAGYLKADIGLTDSEFGGLYMLATLASGMLLMWSGKFADSVATRLLGTVVLAGLILAALAMATVSSAWILGLTLFGLRFFGQGMLTHVAMTAMSRWFERGRGKAISIAALGFRLETQLLAMSGYCFAAALWMTLLAPRLRGMRSGGEGRRA